MQATRMAPLLGLATLAALGLAAHPAQAGIGAITFPSGLTTNRYTGAFSLGFEFTTNTAITVDALGYFDNGSASPFVSDHPVAIYSVGPGGTGILITQATVSNATVNFRAADFAYTYLSGGPITLAAGGDYVVTGAQGNDPFVYNYGVSPTTPSAINYVQSRYQAGNGDEYASLTDASNGYFGASFDIATTTVAPEPSSVAAFAFTGLGAGGLMLRARKRRAS